MIPGHEVPPVWIVSMPSGWPSVPPLMSISTLFELEACPRRWALNNADFPNVWEKHGYPRPLHWAAIEGGIVHSVLEKITDELTENQCSSLGDEKAFSVIRSLGGFTSIIQDGIETALKSFEGNPRATRVLEGVRLKLLGSVPELRSRVQRMLSRINFECAGAIKAGSPAKSPNRLRHRLDYGAHTEVELRAAELGWHGIADLLTLSGECCEIRDYKTGEPKPKHEFQIRTYALLYARDTDLNPSGRLANRLVLSYNDRDVSVPAPNEEELISLGNELRNRTTMALADLKADQPQARPSKENCSHCFVRHLCEEYWNWHVVGGGQAGSSNSSLIDVQIRLTARHGPLSWDGIVEASPVLRPGQLILLRTSDTPFDLRPGRRVRVLNMHVMANDDRTEEESPTIVGATGTSGEMFLVPSEPPS